MKASEAGQVDTIKTNLGEINCEDVNSIEFEDAVFWVLAPCSLVEPYRLLDVLAASIVALMM
jgi:hypothetical protein